MKFFTDNTIVYAAKLLGAALKRSPNDGSKHERYFKIFCESNEIHTLCTFYPVVISFVLLAVKIHAVNVQLNLL